MEWRLIIFPKTCFPKTCFLKKKKILLFLLCGTNIFSFFPIIARISLSFFLSLTPAFISILKYMIIQKNHRDMEKSIIAHRYWINSGMVTLWPYFLGRVANPQSCRCRFEEPWNWNTLSFIYYYTTTRTTLRFVASNFKQLCLAHRFSRAQLQPREKGFCQLCIHFTNSSCWSHLTQKEIVS